MQTKVKERARGFGLDIDARDMAGEEEPCISARQLIRTLCKYWRGGIRFERCMHSPTQ